MVDNDYEYRDLMAKSWDLFRGDPSLFNDRQFFLDFITNYGEPILDVGCGTGRILLECLADGLDIEGMDVSPEMLAICKKKADQLSLPVTVYCQAMESMQIPRQFQTIIVPSYSFQLMPDLGAANRALDNFLNHLLPGGTIVISVWHIMSEGKGEWGEWWLVAEKVGFEDGKHIKRWERSMYDAGTQLRHTENRYEIVEDGEVVFTEMHRRSPELRNYSLSQITGMLEQAGYSEIRAVSGYSSDPATEDDNVFCIQGMKK